MPETILCCVAHPRAIRFAAPRLSIPQAERPSLEEEEFEQVEPSARARRQRHPRRIRKIVKVAASSPFPRANRDRMEESGRREFLRELVPLEMRPDLLRPD